MADITVKIDTKEVALLFKKMQKQGKSVKPLLVRIWAGINKEVHLNFRMQSAPPDIFTVRPGNARKKWRRMRAYTAKMRGNKGSLKSFRGSLLQDSGKLFASMGKIMSFTKDSVTYGTPEWLSGVHHFGKVIRPVKAKMLALPFPGITGRPRSYDNTFIKGKVIYQNVEGNKRAKKLFFLKDKVKIPARPHITISKKTIDRFGTMTLTHLFKGNQ